MIVPFMFLVNQNEISSRGKSRTPGNAQLWQNITTGMVSLIAVLNIFIAVFGNRSQNAIVKRLRQFQKNA